MKIVTSERVLELLKQLSPNFLDIQAIMVRLSTDSKIHYQSTVERALRRMREKGKVQSQQDSKYGVKWAYGNSSTTNKSLRKHAKKVTFSTPLFVPHQIMCRPDNMPTLCQAIDRTVGMMVGTKTRFSAYDITKSIRSEISDGIDTGIDPTETGTVKVDGKDVPKIDHEVVKEAVHDIFHRGEMTGYDRTHNGQYWEYHEAIDDDSGDAIDDGSNGVPDGGSYDGTPTL